MSSEFDGLCAPVYAASPTCGVFYFDKYHELSVDEKYEFLIKNTIKDYGYPLFKNVFKRFKLERWANDPIEFFDEEVVIAHKDADFDYDYLTCEVKFSTDFISKMADKLDRQKLIDTGFYDVKERVQIMKAFKDVKTNV